MLSDPPPKFRKRRAKPNPTPPAPAPSVTVVSVTVDDTAYGAVWEFSQEIVLLGGGGGNVPELEIDGEGLGFIGPDEVMQVGPTKLHGDYFSSSGIEIGNAWRVIVQPGNLSPAVMVPESGEVQ
jgi:hypothetical protein